MPGAFSGEGSLCPGIQFGAGDWTFGDQGMSSSTTSNLVGAVGANRNLKKFRHVSRRAWRNLSSSGEK